MTLWPSLPPDAREAITTLQEDYGARLYDYSRTQLAEADAALATCGALLSAHANATLLVNPAHLQAWLYALARAHRTAAASPASTGSWRRPTFEPGPAPELVPEALATLEAPHREVLDLALRHDLDDAEIGLIFDVPAEHIAAVLAEASDTLEVWFAAVTAALSVGGCEPLTAQVTDWSATPTRRTRTQISRHISDCPACQAAPRSASAAELMTQLTPLPVPDTLSDSLSVAEPLPDEPDLWRDEDGFPVQAPNTLTESAAVDLDQRARSAAAIPAAPTPDLGSAVSAAEQDEFRNWDRRAAKSEELFTEDPQMWAAREDEADPEARLSLRSVARVGAVAVVGVGVALMVIRGLFATGEAPRVQAAPQGDTAALPSASPDVVLELPPTDETQPPEVVITVPAAVPTKGPKVKPTVKPTAKPTVKAATQSQAPTPGGPGEPPRTRPTTKPTTRPTVKPSTQPTVKPSSQPTTKAPLPKPATPQASAVGGGDLGTSRSGSIGLSVSPGTGSITSASGGSGITVSGNSYTITDGVWAPGCKDTTRSGTITVSWSGTNTGDGTTTEGTTSGSGTLTVSVSWTVKADKGYLVASPNGDYWSNCH